MQVKNLGNYFITASCLVREAMAKMDAAGGRILIVLDEQKKLAGVLTDGDIRRGILAAGGVEGSVSEIVNADPVFLQDDYFDVEEAKQLMLDKDIEVIPVVDASKQVVDILFWKELFGDKKSKVFPTCHGVPVVIMAGGKGRRLEPFTNVLPKPLIPINEKPILEMMMARFQSVGVKDFYLVINYKGEMIKAYLDSIENDYNIHYVWEKNFLGTAGGLRLLPKDIANTFIVSNCDILVKADYADVLKFHRENNNFITILGSLQRHVIPYGVIKYSQTGTVEKVTEKPEYDITINTGIYVIEKKSLDLIPDVVPGQSKEFHLTDLIALALKNQEKIGVYPVSEKSYLDIGQWEEYHHSLRVIAKEPNFLDL